MGWVCSPPSPPSPHFFLFFFSLEETIHLSICFLMNESLFITQMKIKTKKKIFQVPTSSILKPSPIEKDIIIYSGYTYQRQGGGGEEENLLLFFR